MDIAKNHPRSKPGLPPDVQASASGWMPHPATQIMIWIFLAVLAQALHSYALIALSALMLAISMWLSPVRLLGLLRRTRWISVSLLLVYAYATPGASCWAALGVFSPSCGGLLDGLVQLLRLLTVLTGLAILLDLLSLSQMTGGLYILAYPLRYLGISRERIAVRLALTLGYAESAMRDTAQDWRASMVLLIKPIEHTDLASVELPLRPFVLRDALLLVLATAVLLGVIW